VVVEHRINQIIAQNNGNDSLQRQLGFNATLAAHAPDYRDP
jgi:hypothetical protein